MDEFCKIKTEIERLIQDWRLCQSSEGRYRLEAYKELLEWIDSLKGEPVSKDLMDATNNYCVNVRKGYPRVMDETDRYICNAFKAGAEWQKEQMNKIENYQEEGWYSSGDDEYICAISFDEPIKLPVEFYYKKKEVNNEDY